MFIRIAKICCCVALLSVVGCTQGQMGAPGNPFAKNQLPAQNYQANGLNASNNSVTNQELASTVQELTNKLSSFDSSNQELHTEIAQLKRALAVSNDEKGLLKQQMSDTLTRYKKLVADKSSIEDRLTAIQASARTQSGAEIRANNSLLEKLQKLNLSGIEVKEDSDVIRIFLPSDQLFEQGRYTFQRTGQATLDQVALELKRHFPRQIIGIEGHLDNQTVTGSNSAHQISATQALAVFDYYQKTGAMSRKQLFILGHGDNRPRYSNSSAKGQAGNRRVEIVIYPETIN